MLLQMESALPLKERCEQSLSDYCKNAWPILEPDVPYRHNWHIDMICDHLEAVVNGDIENLLINVPPGSGKSFICAVALPTWAWTTRPGLRFMHASYAIQLSLRDSQRCRELINDPWYQSMWGDRFQILSDQNQKSQFHNNMRGWRVTTSIGSLATGIHPDVFIVDDPQSAMQATSEAERM